MIIGILTPPTTAEAVPIIQNPRVEQVLITTSQQLNQIDGLLIYGEHTTSLGNFLVQCGLIQPVLTKARENMPVWGLGAGLYLMARSAAPKDGIALHLMDIVADKEIFTGSYSALLYIQALGHEPVACRFHNGPAIMKVSPQVGIMGYHRDKIVMARQGNLLASAFLPVPGETRPENYFLNMVAETQD